jgi:putative phosphoribosyl transferase
VIEDFLLRVAPLYHDRHGAGRELAAALAGERRRNPVVVGLACGGVAVAVEVARALHAPLDVVAVRKIRHPRQPEVAVGAVAPGDTTFVLGDADLTEDERAAAIAHARREAAALDDRLHAVYAPLDLAGRTVLLVDDGFATGATMAAAVRWARGRGAVHVVAAVAVAASRSLELVAAEADAVVCPHALSPFFAVGAWYAQFAPVRESEVLALLAQAREPQAA